MICYYCERELNVPGDYHLRATKDHVIPISKGGRKKSPINQVDCCSACNTLKDNLLPQQFIVRLNLMILERRGFKGLKVSDLEKVISNVDRIHTVVNLSKCTAKKQRKIEPLDCGKDAHLSVNNSYYIP